MATEAELNARRQELQRLLQKPPGDYSGKIDGQLGSMSLAAFQRLATARPDTGSLSLATGAGARLMIVQVAREFIGLRETSPNHAPHLKEFWAATSYPDGEDDRAPWCSAYASFCVQEADRRSSGINLPVPPNFPAVAQWVPWARANGCTTFSPAQVRSGSYRPMAGDICVKLPLVSHIFIVELDYHPGNDYVVSIEGNTNGAGSREGDGVYDGKHRGLNSCGTFIRIPASVT